MQERRNHLLGAVQRLYITLDAFRSNDLLTYASAGAYSFLLSLLPIALMALLILLRILHASPEALISIVDSATIFSDALDISRFFDSVMAIKSIGIFEVIVGLSVFWMARRVFASIQQGMRIIYRKKGKKKAIKENLVVIASEVILVVVIVAVTGAVVAANAFFRTTISRGLIPPLLFALVRNLLRFVPLGILFGFLFLAYYITPRARPNPRQSVVAAAVCTGTFALTQFLFRSFATLARYNLVYGILSNLIVLLLEVYLFFVFFLLFAQFQYVSQYFESFVLAQIYLLPEYDDPRPLAQLRRVLFIKPDIFYRRYACVREAGATIFAMGEESTELYFVCHGVVTLSMPNRMAEVRRGGTFGEFSGLIGGARTSSARAETNVVLLRIPAEIFRETIEVDGATSRKTLLGIADYLRRSNNAVEPLSPEA